MNSYQYQARETTVPFQRKIYVEEALQGAIATKSVHMPKPQGFIDIGQALPNAETSVALDDLEKTVNSSVTVDQGGEVGGIASFMGLFALGMEPMKTSLY